MNDRSLTILMPAYNEESCIERAVAAASECGHRLLSSGRIDRFEVVVVDDGSSDSTAQLLAGLATQHPDLRHVSHPSNRGLGAALRTGFDSLATDLVFYTDADLPVDLRTVDRALEALRRDGADLVCAHRTTKRGTGPRRLAYSVGYNALCRLLYGIRLRDVNFAAKLLRTEVLESMQLRSEGSFIDAEVVARAVRDGRRIEEIPAEYLPRTHGVSTLSSPRVILTILREMWSLTADIRRGPRTPSAVDSR